MVTTKEKWQLIEVCDSKGDLIELEIINAR